ncbi:MAG: CHAD domain-containing protein, partial [Chloroflexota bacterium]
HAGEILFTVKQLRSTTDAIHRREEFEITLPADQPPAQWEPSPARDLVLGLVGDQPLAPLCDLRQTRLVRAISRADQSIATMSLDHVRIMIGKRTRSFRELEIELAHEGSEDDLAAIANCLQNEWKLSPAPRSKFERALEFVNEHSGVRSPVRAKAKRKVKRFAPSEKLTAPGITPNDPMAEAARKVLAFQFQRMVAHEAGTRAGQDIEELHDMRVATRRLRAALRVFEKYLDDNTIKPFAKSLRRAARLLGATRDLDVFRAQAQRYLDQLPTERKTELDPLLAAWQTQYDSAREELVAYFDSEDYNTFKERFDELLQTPGAGAVPNISEDDEPLPYRVRHVLPQILFEHVAHVRAYDEWISSPDAPLTRYHQLRIACKRLRYALEFFREVLGVDVEGLIEKLKQLQDHLGNLQDAMVACNILRSFLMWGTWAPDKPAKKSASTELVVAPGIAAYLAARQNEIQDLVSAFPSVWSPITHEEFSRRLTALVAL